MCALLCPSTASRRAPAIRPWPGRRILSSDALTLQLLLLFQNDALCITSGRLLLPYRSGLFPSRSQSVCRVLGLEASCQSCPGLPKPRSGSTGCPRAGTPVFRSCHRDILHGREKMVASSMGWFAVEPKLNSIRGFGREDLLESNLPWAVH
jgi:hypothetical protein